ncbi:MAG: hypothetical protein ACJAS1_002401 [Oleiphilaceae bacterium]|jgi:uncharacterized protein (DUF2384 family)
MQLNSTNENAEAKEELANLLIESPKIHSDLLELFKGVDRVALQWLKAPRPQLLDKSPLQTLEEDPGAVEDLIHRIKTGDLS